MKPNDDGRRKRPKYFVRMGVTVLFGLLIPLNIWAFLTYRHESAEVAQIAREHCGASLNAEDQMRDLLRYVSFDVKHMKNNDYFLLPVFRCLRPTPLQVLTDGGDCSYKGRALVALLQTRGISARKMSLHTPDGAGVHAVVEVKTERGDYLVDPMFGFVLDDDSGSPLSAKELSRPEVLAHVVARNMAAGNPKVHKYPLEKYVYTDVRTYNLEQYRISAAVRRVLVWVFGKQAVDNFPRLRMFGEPALTVMWCSAGLGGIFAAWLIVDKTWAARQRRRASQKPALSGTVPPKSGGPA